MKQKDNHFSDIGIRSQKRLSLIESWKLNGIPFMKMIMVYIFIIIGTEALFRKSLVETISWIADSPFLFLLNLFTLVAISSILLLLTRKIVWVTLFVGTIASVLSFINISKFALRNVPLLFEDLFLVNEVWVLMPQLMNPKTLVTIGLGLVAAVVVGFLLFKFFRKNNLHRHRLAALTLSLLSIGVLFIGQDVYAANVDISETGFIYSLSNSTREQGLVVDEEQLKTAGTLYEKYIANYDTSANQDEPATKPNVIVVQSEAFWDINKMGIEMSENPIPNFEALRKESRYGELYVPVIGGGTSNTEYEILTGMTLKNYSNDWYMVYPNEIKSPTVSLASIFKNQGYETMGIHPYQSWYYNRAEVYKHLGFDSFRTLELMNDTDIIGTFTSDKYTTDLIIDAIEKTEKPLFNFTVTMQNHGPYGNFRFSEDQFDIKVESKASDSAQYLLSNYVQGIYLSDIELARLVEYLKQCDEPTILVFYGDHLPMLGEDYQAYREVGYVDDEDNASLQVDLRMMAVPYIIWSNYDNTSKELPTMNASFFTSVILEEAKADMPDYLKALAMAREQMPLYFRTFGYDVTGEKLGKDSPLFLSTQALYVSIYDQLKKGEGTEGWLVEDDGHYNKSITDITITQASASGKTTKVTGTNFYDTMTVTVGKEKVEFDFISETEIEIKKALKSTDVVTLSVIDSEGKVIAESTPFILP